MIRKILGFTLIEVAIVVLIVAIMAGAAVPIVQNNIKKAKDGRAISNTSIIKQKSADAFLFGETQDQLRDALKASDIEGIKVAKDGNNLLIAVPAGQFDAGEYLQLVRGENDQQIYLAQDAESANTKNWSERLPFIVWPGNPIDWDTNGPADTSSSGPPVPPDPGEYVMENLVATYNSGEVTLNWDLPVTATQAKIDHYEIIRTVDGSPKTITTPDNNNVDVKDNFSFVEGKTYYYTVKAVLINSAGTSLESNSDDVLIPVPSYYYVIQDPTALTTSVSLSQITINFYIFGVGDYHKTTNKLEEFMATFNKIEIKEINDTTGALEPPKNGGDTNAVFNRGDFSKMSDYYRKAQGSPSYHSLNIKNVQVGMHAYTEEGGMGNYKSEVVLQLTLNTSQESMVVSRSGHHRFTVEIFGSSGSITKQMKIKAGTPDDSVFSSAIFDELTGIDLYNNAVIKIDS